MAMLHIVNKSPFEKVTFDSCLGHASAGDSILMIENAANDGEYKVFNVKSDSTAVAGSQFTVTLVGTIDFGETYTQDDNGAASNFV